MRSRLHRHRRRAGHTGGDRHLTLLFHTSDLHFGTEDRAALDWFAAAVAAERPDAVVVTGDITARARRREFAAAADWFERLGAPVTIEPGNHDLPYFNLAERMATPYARVRALKRRVETPLDLPGAHIVPLKTTARIQPRLNWSKGRVSRRALGEAVAALNALPADELALVASHHPLIEAGTIGTARTRRGGRALAALAAAGADAVLTGHVHDPFEERRDIAGRSICLIGAGTLSERVRATPPSFNAIRLTGSDIEVRVRRMA